VLVGSEKSYKSLGIPRTPRADWATDGPPVPGLISQ
jgi:hypothetical protein